MASYAGKKCQNGKNIFPLEPSSRWLSDGQKKSTFRPLWPKLWGFKVQRTKNDAKSAHLNADLELGSRFGLE